MFEEIHLEFSDTSHIQRMENIQWISITGRYIKKNLFVALSSPTFPPNFHDFQHTPEN